MKEIVDLFNKIRKQGGEHILFVGATILSAGVYFIYSIYVRAYVLPFEYGMYSTCILLQTYMSYLQFGTLNAFNRDYPQLIGAGKDEEAIKYRNTVFSFLLLIYSIFLALVIVSMFIVGKIVFIDNRIRIGFIFAAIIAVTTIIENYGNYRCRIDNGFKYTSIVTLLELFSIVVGVILVPMIGYYSIYITSILAMIIGIVFFYQSSYSDFRFVLDIKLLKNILISGAPLLINGLIWTVINSIDKFVILGYINTEALGEYGIAQNAFSYMLLIPSAMAQLFYVKMGKEYGESGKVDFLMEMSLKITSILAAVTSIIALTAFFFLPILVDTFMPSYSNGVLAAQVLIIGLSIYAATLINGNILTILKKNSALLMSSFCMCGFNIICSIFFVTFLGREIEYVALGTAVSYIFCASIIIYQVHKFANCEVLKLINASVIPICISLVPGLLVYSLIRNRIIGFIIAILFVLFFYGFYFIKQFVHIKKEKK